MSHSQQTCVITHGTGTQGRSVAKAMSEAGYRVRVLTRDPSSATAKQAILGLSNATLVRCDVNDLTSVREAFEGANVVYALSVLDDRIVNAPPNTDISSLGLSEAEQGMRYADVAHEKGVRAFVWSSLPDAAKNSKNTYRNISHFQEKVFAQNHIDSLGMPAVHILPAMFMENFTDWGLVRTAADGQIDLTFHRANPDEKCYPMIYIGADLGRLVVTLVKNMDKVKGQSIKVFERCYSMKECADAIEKVTGKKVKIVEKNSHIVEGSDMDEMFQYFADNRYSFYEGGDTPDQRLEMLGFKFTPFSQFCTEKLAPFLRA